MIPAKIVRFLHDHGNMGFAGIRDRDCRPSGCRVSAWQLSADARTLTAWVPMPEAYRARFLDALLDNGRIAITIEEHQSHETYQLKGRYLRHREAAEEDREPVRRHRERLGRAIRTQVPPGVDVEPLLLAMYQEATYVIEVEIDEVFVQTPGPGAGRRVHPAPDPMTPAGS